MRALILAAGRGERMRPLTDSVPKPLLRAGGRRLIEWQLGALAAAGIREIVVNTAHLPQQFETVLGTGAAFGVSIAYSREGERAEDALETLGGIVRALPLLGSAPFVVVSGDIVTDFDYSTLRPRAHALAAGAADAHLVLVDNPSFHAVGDMGLVDGLIAPDATERLTYANIGVFAPALFAGLADGRARLFPWLYGAARAGRVTGEHFGGRWHNVGTPDELARLDAELGRAGRLHQRDS
jgi:N-acetyl-alpha-D-muramate 1-phosphate uridylyltransferase